MQTAAQWTSKSVRDWKVFQTISRTPRIRFLLLWAEAQTAERSILSLSLSSFLLEGFCSEFPTRPAPPFYPCSPAPLLQKHILLIIPVGPQGSRARRKLGKQLFRSVNSRVRVQVDVFDPYTASEQQLSQGQDHRPVDTSRTLKVEWKEGWLLSIAKEEQNGVIWNKPFIHFAAVDGEKGALLLCHKMPNFSYTAPSTNSFIIWTERIPRRIRKKSQKILLGFKLSLGRL